MFAAVRLPRARPWTLDMPSKQIAALTALPILSVVLYIHFFGLNIPFWDQWNFVSYLMLAWQGQLTPASLLAQLNEHRPFFPRLIWLALASLTNYNIKAELWMNLAIAVSVFIFFIRRIKRTWIGHGVDVPQIVVPLLSLLIFNLGQRESWVQGFQTIMFLCMAGVVIGFFLLTDRNWMSFAIAAVLGVVANFSMVTGVLFWILGLFILILNENQRSRIVKGVVWIAISAASLWVFFSGWASYSQINLTYLFTHPLEWMVWLLNFLGAPIFAFWYVAWIFGGLSLFLYGTVIVQTVRSGLWKVTLPYFAIAIFILATALSISLGRIEFGLRQSTVSRYLTLSAWYWASLLALLPFVQFKRLRINWVYMLLTASLTVLTFAGGWVGYVRLHLRILPAYQSVVSNQLISDEDLAQIHFDPAIAGPQIEFLSRNGLSAWGQQAGQAK